MKKITASVLCVMVATAFSGCTLFDSGVSSASGIPKSIYVSGSLASGENASVSVTY